MQWANSIAVYREDNDCNGRESDCEVMNGEDGAETEDAVSNGSEDAPNSPITSLIMDATPFNAETPATDCAEAEAQRCDHTNSNGSVDQLNLNDPAACESRVGDVLLKEGMFYDNNGPDFMDVSVSIDV